MEYFVGQDLETAGHFDALSFSFSSPFPLLPGGDGDVHRRETFGRPFRVRGHHRVVFDLLIQPDTFCCFEAFSVGHTSQVGFADDLDFNPLDFDVGLVPVPVPEPGNLTILALSVILSAAAARRMASNG